MTIAIGGIPTESRALRFHLNGVSLAVHALLNRHRFIEQYILRWVHINVMSRVVMNVSVPERSVPIRQQILESLKRLCKNICSTESKLSAFYLRTFLSFKTVRDNNFKKYLKLILHSGKTKKICRYNNERGYNFE